MWLFSALQRGQRRVGGRTAQLIESGTETEIQVLSSADGDFCPLQLPCNKARTRDWVRRTGPSTAGVDSKRPLLIPRVHVDTPDRGYPARAGDLLGVMQ